MRRRGLIALVAGAAVARPLSADAQAARVARVGILSDEGPSVAAKSFEPSFAQGLRDLGWIEGQNIAFDRRYADEKDEILPSLATELVGVQPDVILAVGTAAARAAKTATRIIPVVFARVSDPIASGLVSSLARPGGNLTGVTVQTRDLASKLLQLLTEAVPDTKRVGALWDPNFPPASLLLERTQTAARDLNMELVPTSVRSPDDFEPAVRAMVQKGASALLVLGGGIFFEHSRRLVDVTVKAQLPAVFLRREQVEAGGLMSYGTSFPDMYRRAAAYVDKILKGARPADLPVEQPTKFELVINLKTAKAFGLKIPPLLLVRADEVIE